MGAGPDHADDRDIVNQWLRGLSRRTGVALRLDDEGVCAIGFAHELDGVIEVPGDGSVYLRCALMPWPGQDAGPLAERCLGMNFLGIDTDGACLSLDTERRELVLWSAVALAVLDDRSFSLRMSAFMKSALRLRDLLGPPHRAPKAGNLSPAFQALLQRA